MSKTLSCSAGTVAMKHDRRDYTEKNLPENVNPEMMQYNIYLKKCPNERQAFNQFFKESVDEYNSQQSRSDRKKTDYYADLQKSKNGETPIYEYVFQIGNRDDTPCRSDDGLRCRNILRSYAIDFETKNPNFHVLSSCIHMDEETPHLHIAFIPFATGYKKGLKTRCSTSKALESMGYTGENRNMREWKRAQEDHIEELMKEYGIERERKGTTREHLPVSLYKETLDKAKEDALSEVQSELDELTSQISEKTAELTEAETSLNYALNDYEAVKAEFEDYLEERESLLEAISDLKAEKSTLISDISRLKAFRGKLCDDIRDLIDRIKKTLSTNAGMLQKEHEFIESRGLKAEFVKFLYAPVKQAEKEFKGITTLNEMRNRVNRSSEQPTGSEERAEQSKKSKKDDIRQ